VLAKFFEQRDYKVIKLGICVKQEEFVNAAVETNADAVFVSSLYGMGFGDMEGLRDKLVEAGKGDIILYAGGILSVGAESVWKNTEDQWKQTEAKFQAIGFNRAYSRDAKLEQVFDDLNGDLKVEAGSG
jgi:methylaspartate mutase sigma subunit